MGDIRADRGSAVSIAKSRYGNATANASAGGSQAVSVAGVKLEEGWTLTNKLSLCSIALGVFSMLSGALQVFGESVVSRVIGTALQLVLVVGFTLSALVDVRYRTTGPRVDVVAKLSRSVPFRHQRSRR